MQELFEKIFKKLSFNLSPTLQAAIYRPKKSCSLAAKAALQAHSRAQFIHASNNSSLRNKARSMPRKIL
jgi:hypothetical protein